METLTIKIFNSKTLKLLKDLEDLNLIQVISHSNEHPAQQRPSQKLYGSITEKQAQNMHDELNKMRTEWNRNI